ncbi:hypothetical protein FRC01_004740 [Tulasnella sp. 417]|nr:hypothetical protein FRC01_004740 [Tulasnella sp. 417]
MNRSRTIWSVLCLVAWLGLCSAQLPNVTVDFSCKSGYEWMLNGKGENPCRVYAYLSAQSHCFSDDTWTVEPLDSGHKRYPPPSGDDATPWFPSTTRWSDWTDECEDTYQGFPYGLTPDIDIPAWANLDVIQADKWSEAVAKTYAASADSQNQPTSTPDPQNSQAEHNKAIKIIIGSCVGVGCLLIIVGVIIWYSLRKKHRRSPTGGVESPSDSGTLKRPTSGVPGGSQVGSNISTLPMVQTMGQYPPTYGGKQRGERPTSGVTGDPQVGAAQPTVQAKGQTAPTWGPTRRRDQDPRPRRRDEDDSPPGGRDSPDPSSTDETPHLKPPVYLAQRLPSSGTRVDEDEDEDEPVYRPSSAYQTSNQAMMNWRSGTAGGPSSSSQQPVSAQWGNGPAGEMSTADSTTTPRADGAANYIVVFKNEASQDEISSFISDAKVQGATVNHTYTNVFKGFSASMNPSHMQSLKGHNIVEYIEPDQIVTISPVNPTPQVAEPQN